MTLIPAYGRDYKSKAAVLSDWNDGVDFQIMPSGQYTTKTELGIYSATATVTLRYAKLTRFIMANV